MQQICADVPGCKLINIVAGGITPELPMNELSQMGYGMAVYPLTLMASAVQAIVNVLDLLKQNAVRQELIMDFGELRSRIGFDAYYEAVQR